MPSALTVHRTVIHSLGLQFPPYSRPTKKGARLCSFFVGADDGNWSRLRRVMPSALTVHRTVIHSLGLQFPPYQRPTKKGAQSCTFFCWCGRRELNPYDSHHTPLKRARLPVPPLPRAVAIATTSFIILFFRNLSSLFSNFLAIFSIFTEFLRKCMEKQRIPVLFLLPMP